MIKRSSIFASDRKKSPADATNLLYRQSWATLDGSGNVSGVKLASHGNWMQWTVDSNGGTAGGSSTQSRQVNLVNEIDTDNIDGDADDPITGSSWIDPVYDKSGNMTKAPKGQGSETTAVYFVYDGWGRAAGISSTASHDGDFADAGEVQYEYDGMGRRISKTFAGTSIADEDTFWNEAFQALETRRNGSANAYEQTVYDIRYIDAPVLRYRDANGHPTSTSTGDGTLEEVLYVTHDANFNVTGLVQENQTFVERYVNTPFGDRLVRTGTFGSRGTTSYDLWLGHQGLRIDAESGTYYNRARQGYHPGIGAFTQRDPKLTEYQDGMSLYQPYSGNPLTKSDPSGLAPVQPLSGVRWPIGNSSASPLPYPGQPGVENYPEPSFLQSPDEGKPCCGKPATLQTFIRTDGPVQGDIANPSISYVINGDYANLKIRWWTCERKDRTIGVIPGSNDSNSTKFKLGWGPYLVHATLSFTTCENGKTVTKAYRRGGSYVYSIWSGWKIDPAPGTGGPPHQVR